MIIDNLNTLPTPVQSTDEIPVERGTSTYKMTAAMLAAALASIGSYLPKSATITVQVTTAGLIPFTGITPTSIISAISNGYVIIPCKTATGSWRGMVTDLSFNIVTSEPTITVDVLYY